MDTESSPAGNRRVPVEQIFLSVFLLIARVRVLLKLGSDQIIEIIRFNNSNRCSEVSYVAPLSEDIDLK